MTQIKPHLDRLAWQRRRRIEISPSLRATEPADARESDLRQLKVLLREPQQVRAFCDHRRADPRVVTGDQMPLIFVAGGQQPGVELIDVPRLRDRHPVIAAKVASLALDSTLLVRLRQRAEVDG